MQELVADGGGGGKGRVWDGFGRDNSRVMIRNVLIYMDYVDFSSVLLTLFPPEALAGLFERSRDPTGIRP